MDSLEHLKSIKKYDDKVQWELGDSEFFNYRKAKALEIIAEELICISDDLKRILK